MDYDSLTPQQRTAVINNAGKRIHGGASRSSIETMLRNNPRALAQAMEYTGVGNVPANLREDPGSAVLDINQLIDKSMGDDAYVEGAAQGVSDANSANNAAGGANTSAPPVPNAKPGETATPADEGKFSGGDLAKWAAIAAAAGISLLAAKRLLSAYNSRQRDPQTVAAAQAIYQAANDAGVDPNAITLFDDAALAEADQVAQRGGRTGNIIEGQFEEVSQIEGPRQQPQLPTQPQKQTTNQRAPMRQGNQPPRRTRPQTSTLEDTLRMRVPAPGRVSTPSSTGGMNIPNLNMGMDPNNILDDLLPQVAPKPRVRVKTP